ncbi:MAG TPA: outer membrane lipoprotein carrier protein LolA [Pyrinomonadaceae bacterium]|nr:outer membrane lipoprotein carrier protein LolA [Pyrinomonadaceae bacterium]
MKRLFPLSFIALILATLVFILPAATHAQSAGLVSSVLNKMERNRQSLKSLRAGISMEKYNAQLRDAERYDGIVAYLPGAGRDASVRIEWRSPQHEVLAVSNGSYTLFRPRLKMAYRGKSNNPKVNKNTGNLMEMLYMSRQQLEAKFHPVQDVREETLWGGVSTIHLTLVPKGNANFKYAEIWVDGAGMPIQTKIVEKNDDSTTMRLSNLQKNVPISSGEFSLKLDSDIKVVKS